MVMPLFRSLILTADHAPPTYQLPTSTSAIVSPCKALELDGIDAPIKRLIPLETGDGPSRSSSALHGMPWNGIIPHKGCNTEVTIAAVEPQRRF
jgi:hypothetical protein